MFVNTRLIAPKMFAILSLEAKNEFLVRKKR